MNTPEKEPLPPDELERLEKLHEKMKDEQEAWGNVRESLGKLKSERTEPNEPKK